MHSDHGSLGAADEPKRTLDRNDACPETPIADAENAGVETIPLAQVTVGMLGRSGSACAACDGPSITTATVAGTIRDVALRATDLVIETQRAQGRFT